MADYNDSPVFGAMIALQQCLCETIEARGLPSVCFCGVVPGSTAVFDYSDEGQAWVRLSTAVPSLVFPAQDQSLRSCSAPLAYQFEVGIVRCAPMLADDGSPPSLEEQFEATRLQMADMDAIRYAIECCLPHASKVLGTYTPYGPQGGALGGWWTVFTDGLVV